MAPVNALLLATLTFGCAFGGALLGAYIRSLLPPNHLSKESQDVMRLGMGLVATMTALLLGLVTASARSSFDSQDAAMRTNAANILTLDRLLARYGPETRPTREHDPQARRLPDRERPGPTMDRPARDSRRPLRLQDIEQVENQILQLAPATDAQRWFKSEALKLSEEVSKSRWRILSSQGGSVPIVFLIVVISWLAFTFTSFGLYARRTPRSSPCCSSRRYRSRRRCS